jgi:hypothetical protein
MTFRARRGAALALATLLFTPAAYADDLRERVERMEQELRALKEELKRRDGGQALAPAAEAPPPSRAAEPPSEPRPTATAKAEEKPSYRQVLDRVKLGGYGSMRYEASNLDQAHSTFTLRRFVLTADANIAPRLRAYMELEFERFRKIELEKSFGAEEGGIATKQTVGGTADSEISFEQGWLQYDIEDWLKFRGGAVLVPVGRFNLNHDDNLWDLPRRSLVDRGVSVLPVPAAWDELGVGFLGEVPTGKQGLLNYQAYVVNGVTLGSEFEQEARTHGANNPGEQEIDVEIAPETGTFGSDVKNAKALTGRLAWSPALGHEIAASGYWGQYTPDFLGREDVWSLGLDGKTGFGPFEVEGEYVFTRFEGLNSVARQLASVAAESEQSIEGPELESVVKFDLTNISRDRQGYWLDLRYRFWPAVLNDTYLGRYFDNPQMVAVLRGEQVWLGDRVTEVAFSGGSLTAFDTEDRRVDRITAGLAYRPVPLVVFHLAYEYTLTNSGKSLAGVTNFLPAQEHEDTAHTVMVGAAFGF